MAVRVSVIGGGSWGTTMAHLCAHNTPTILFARDEIVAEAINTTNENPRYLPGCLLHPELAATTDTEVAVSDADLVVMAVPSHGFRAALQRLAPHIKPRTSLVSLTKGLEHGTGMRMTEVAQAELPDSPVGVFTGPNLAKEIMAGHATAAVLAMSEPSDADWIRTVMAASHLRIYTSSDVIGAEMAGATKNVIALAAGIADGLGAGDNTRAALITRGLAEMTRLGVAAGGDPLTFPGLAGMGDLVATCVSAQSRNHQVGVRLGSGEPISEIVASMDQVAEGVKSTPVVTKLARSLGVDMPLATQVKAVLTGKRPAAEAYRALLDRPPTSEIHR